LDPSPYLNVIRAGPSTTAKPIRRVRITPNQRLEWLQQRDAARQHMQKGDLEFAKQQFQSIIMTKGALLPSRVVAGLHLELGDVLLLMGDDEQCRHHYLEAQAFVPQAYLPHARLAKLSIQLGHLDKAIEHYKHALFFNHSHLMSLHNIGSLLFIQCKVEEAWYYFDVAIHGSDRSEDYRRVSWVVPMHDGDDDSTSDEDNEDADAGGRDGEQRKDRLVRNKRRNTQQQNYEYSRWLTSHIMMVFVDAEKDREEHFQVKNMTELLKGIELSSDVDRSMVIGITLNSLSFHLDPMGLHGEALNIWTMLHALGDESNGYHHSYEHTEQDDFTSTSLNGLAFLMEYANAVPQLLYSNNDEERAVSESGSVIDEMWERRKRIKERFDVAKESWIDDGDNVKDIDGQKKMMTMLKLMSMESHKAHVVPVGKIAADGRVVRILTSHMTSATLLSSSSSISNDVRLVSEMLTSWTMERFPTLYRVRLFETVWMPPSDPSHNLPFDRKQILRLAGKARLQRKVARRKLRKKRKNKKIRQHEEIRDEIAYRTLKNKKKENKNKNKGKGKNSNNVLSAVTAAGNSELPVIRVGFVCESLDPYMYSIKSPVSKHIVELLKATVKRYHVTIYIPQWHHNRKKTEKMKRQLYDHVLMELMDDYAVMTKINELSIQDVEKMDTKLTNIFTMKTMTKRMTEENIPRLDVLVFVAPTLDSTAHFLAHSRIAPVQIGFWAGTGTSGLGGVFSNDDHHHQMNRSIGHMDYFVSSEMIHRSTDVDASQLSYTEQLVLLPHAGTIFPMNIDGLPDSARSGSPVQYKYKYRSDQSRTLHLYAKYDYVLVLHDELYQLHEQFDSVLAHLLVRNKNLQILLVGTSEWNGWRENPLGYGRLVARIRRAVDRLVKSNMSNRKAKEDSNDTGSDESNGKTFLDGGDGGDGGGGSGGSGGSGSSGSSKDRREDSSNDSSVSSVWHKSTYIKQRIRHLTGLSKMDYYSLLAAVNVVLDPGTEDGGGTERVLLPAVEAMMIGTPIVTFHPSIQSRGWERVRPTSSVASLLRSVGGNVMTQTCVAKNEIEYVNKVSLLLNDLPLQRKMRKISKENITPWMKTQNKEVEHAWFNFLERVGRPYANWRVMNVKK